MTRANRDSLAGYDISVTCGRRRSFARSFHHGRVVLPVRWRRRLEARTGARTVPSTSRCCRWTIDHRPDTTQLHQATCYAIRRWDALAASFHLWAGTIWITGNSSLHLTWNDVVSVNS